MGQGVSRWDACVPDPGIGRPAGDCPVLRVMPREDWTGRVWTVWDERLAPRANEPWRSRVVFVARSIAEATQHMHFLADEDGVPR